MPFRFISLPHLRLLSPSYFFVTRNIMKTNPPSSRGSDVFTRVFPHKLKYQSSSSYKKLGLPNSMTTARSQLQFSTRASKHRSEDRSDKSLIEDEAELSDWVSELKSESFKKSRLYSDSDDVDNDWRGGKGSAVKRKRESDSDDYSGGYGNKDKGGNMSYFNGDSRGKWGSVGEFKRRDERFISRRENSFENGRGGRGSGMLRGRVRVGGEVKRRLDRFPRDRTKEDDGFVSKRRDDSFVGRQHGGGGSGRRGDSSMSRGSLMMSDQDEDDEEVGQKNTMSKFREVISDEDDDDDEAEAEDLDDDDGVLEKGHSIEDGTSSSPRISPDASESYLSETRYITPAILYDTGLMYRLILFSVYIK